VVPFAYELAAFIAIIIGSVLRTMVPYIQKMGEEGWPGFWARYAASMVISIILSLVIAFEAFTPMLESLPISSMSVLAVALLFFLQGWALNDVANRVVTDRLPAPAGQYRLPAPAGQ